MTLLPRTLIAAPPAQMTSGRGWRLNSHSRDENCCFAVRPSRDAAPIVAPESGSPHPVCPPQYRSKQTRRFSGPTSRRLRNYLQCCTCATPATRQPPDLGVARNGTNWVHVSKFKKARQLGDLVRRISIIALGLPTRYPIVAATAPYAGPSERAWSESVGGTEVTRQVAPAVRHWHCRGCANLSRCSCSATWILARAGLVWLWFRSPHLGFAARMMRTSEPPH